jgi:ubiquinone/menaquinone biosynthesis C-methylase UbiE
MVQDARTPEEIRYHYEIEVELADRLRRASRAERRVLYTAVYDELYSRVESIPHRDSEAQWRTDEIRRQVRFLQPFLTPDATFLELGPGDCRLSCAVAAHVAQVHTIDVTSNLVDPSTLPPNVRFQVSRGLPIPLPDNSVDVAFTDQVIEHLHPEDADEHLQEVRRVLSPTGLYVCITPNRLYGPHDASKYFDDVARGLHLKEYSVTELMSAFRRAGYSRTRRYTVTKRVERVRVPRPLVWGVESALDVLPGRLKRGFACTSVLRWILRSRVIGWK